MKPEARMILRLEATIMRHERTFQRLCSQRHELSARVVAAQLAVTHCEALLQLAQQLPSHGGCLAAATPGIPTQRPGHASRAASEAAAAAAPTRQGPSPSPPAAAAAPQGIPSVSLQLQEHLESLGSSSGSSDNDPGSGDSKSNESLALDERYAALFKAPATLHWSPGAAARAARARGGTADSTGELRKKILDYVVEAACLIE